MTRSRTVTVPVLPIVQPIGEFFIGVIDAHDLIEISYADIREMERDLDNYLGIQRKLSPARVKELSDYVNTKDATFPTSIILAVEGQCTTWDEEHKELTLTATPDIEFDHIAKILDGQHRIEGLKGLREDETFQINVTIFVDADIADQANIFATVNLAQTKVNKSLVYDLFDYAESRSPQKTAHDVTVGMDQAKGGPFYQRIKRIGTRTPGRTGETLTQATVVNCLLDLMSSNPMEDRDLLMRGKRLKAATPRDLARMPFRNLFIEGRDVEIAKIVNGYFSAVSQRWPEAWDDRSKGNILARTNGFRAFMRAFRSLYVDMCNGEIGEVVTARQFAGRLSKVELEDQDFNTQNYAPGTSGETALYKDLVRYLGLERDKGLFE